MSWPDLCISIHALREEGDLECLEMLALHSDFYPRPPRGGRPGIFLTVQQLPLISIHALREEGDGTFAGPLTCPRYFYPRPPRGGRPGA